MIVDTESIVTMTEANQNFSMVARCADRNGRAVVFKNNKHRYLVRYQISNKDQLSGLMSISAPIVITTILVPLQLMVKA